MNALIPRTQEPHGTEPPITARTHPPLGACAQARRARPVDRRPRLTHPWQAKALALVVAAYALSPIDLIPDFIPVLATWTIY